MWCLQSASVNNNVVLSSVCAGIKIVLIHVGQPSSDGGQIFSDLCMYGLI